MVCVCCDDNAALGVSCPHVLAYLLELAASEHRFSTQIIMHVLWSYVVFNTLMTTTVLCITLTPNICKCNSADASPFVVCCCCGTVMKFSCFRGFLPLPSDFTDDAAAAECFFLCCLFYISHIMNLAVMQFSCPGVFLPPCSDSCWTLCSC